MCKCGNNNCCCVKTVSKTGPRGAKGDRGPAGPKGDKGDQGESAIIVKNTVYVSKNGNDSTGLPERFDKPFLTLAAARVAAVSLVPSATNRILIVVEKGTYMEPIDLADFVDWDLGSCIIDGSTVGRATIDDFTTTNGVNSVIYGFADIRKSGFGVGASRSCVLIRHAASNVTIYCNKIGSSVGGGIEMTNGTLFVKAKEIYSTVDAPDAFAVGLSSSATATIHADEIYANGHCVGNASSGTLNVTARELRTLNGTTPVVNGNNIRLNKARVVNFVADVDAVYITGSNVILKDCILVGNGTCFSVNAAGATNTRVYGTCYTNKASNNVTALVGAITVDTDVI